MEHCFMTRNPSNFQEILNFKLYTQFVYIFLLSETEGYLFIGLYSGFVRKRVVKFITIVW